MTDPYKVLGISPQASDEEVKTAYRKLSQQYHPDHHADSVMEEIANQKMAEINEAYDQIMNMRRSGANYQNSNSSYTDIRSMIENGNYTAADNILEQNRNDGNAEWNFLKGTVCLSRGWLNDAYTYFDKAVKLDPANREYQAAYSQMQNKRNGQMYGNPYNTGGNTNSTANTLCNLCQCLICADCLCDCI
ncbi:MAG: J domain-containing protein [Oscillospiraceae bacterium]|nr:J domain-containing protein [Oscillospiraceae bacterium]